MTTLSAGESLGTPIATDGTNVYCVGGTDTLEIMKVPIDGGPTIWLASSKDPVTDLVTDGTNVYWTASTIDAPEHSGGVFKVPTSGGSPTVLADHEGTPMAIAVDDTSVYWMNQWSDVQLKGAIRTRPK